MKKLALVASFLFFVGCKKEESLQNYFVESAEKKEFLSLDVSSSILNVNENTLTASEKKALASFDKINILAFKKDGKNNAEYAQEIKEVKEILKDSTYEPLIKMNGVSHNASIMLVGEGNTIDELILFGNQKELGFTIMRVLGDDIKPENAVEFLNILQKSKVDIKQLQPILNFVGKN